MTTPGSNFWPEWPSPWLPHCFGSWWRCASASSVWSGTTCGFMDSWQHTELWQPLLTRTRLSVRGWLSGGNGGENSAAVAAAAWQEATCKKHRELEMQLLTPRHHQNQQQLTRASPQHLRSLCNQVWICWQLQTLSHLISKSQPLKLESSPRHLSAAQLSLQGHHRQQPNQLLRLLKELWRTWCHQRCCRISLWSETTRFAAQEQPRIRISRPGFLKRQECCTRSNWWQLRRERATILSTAPLAAWWVMVTRQLDGTTVQECLSICTGSRRSEAGSCHLSRQLQPECPLCLARRSRRPSSCRLLENETCH